MDLAQVIRRRLKELGKEQRSLAAAAEVTESYISQLLAGRKTPPAPNRTDVYEKIEQFLGLHAGELSKLADLQRAESLKKRVEEPPLPLFKEFRELVLRKCSPASVGRIRDIFSREPFGELERLVTQKLLDVAKNVAREELESEKWLRMVARLGGRSYEQTRVMILEFLDTDVFHVSVDNCVSFMDPLIESWDIDLETFGVAIVLNRRLTLGHLKRFEFVEREPDGPFHVEPGFEEFLRDPLLSANATDEEIEFLKLLRFRDRRPTPLYYYRELQNLRDPLHFRHC
ncbi:MAG: helix-turn-helix transcriptional regulator [Bryobacteraceae bacterium]|nr:helix-turn-helix transcriptional regulator [Bryobacteraceae bacterium]